MPVSLLWPVTTPWRRSRRLRCCGNVPAVVRHDQKRGEVWEPAAHRASANDGRRPAVVTTISRKQTMLLRAGRRAAEPDDPEADAGMRAWLELAKWGGPVG
jgi:hypothetical protein